MNERQIQQAAAARTRRERIAGVAVLGAGVLAWWITGEVAAASPTAILAGLIVGCIAAIIAVCALEGK